MPPIPYDESSRPNSESNRVRESAALFNLPEFDSLPATAGLSNLEAFQLSQRHALALLPSLFAKGWPGRFDDEGTDRFSLV